jgi:riboflavin synthase
VFTGLIEDVGTIRSVQPAGRGSRLTIATSIPLEEVALGDSIAVDGACLTADSFVPGAFVAVAARETLARTTAGRLRAGDRVHLERALRLGDRLDGHLVQGHVDGQGTVLSNDERQESWVLWVRLPTELARFVATKGSITIDGVSLTVNEVHTDRFRVNIVPHTARVTRIASFRPGQPVNLEVDVLAKYVDRLLGSTEGPDLMDRLRANGFR